MPVCGCTVLRGWRTCGKKGIETQLYRRRRVKRGGGGGGELYSEELVERKEALCNGRSLGFAKG